MPHYRQQELLKALTFVLGEMGLRKCMSPFGFDTPMRPPWHMGAYAQLDTRINRTNILFTAWGETPPEAKATRRLEGNRAQ